MRWLNSALSSFRTEALTPVTVPGARAPAMRLQTGST